MILRPSDLNDLSGKVALITGGSGEVGKTISKLLIDTGANVVIQYYKNKKGAEEICESTKGKAIAHRADFRDPASIKDLFNFIETHLGRLDILVHNAHAPIGRTSFLKTSWEAHKDQMDVIVKGIFYCAQHGVPLMEKAGGGSIVLVVPGLVERPVDGYSAYTTASSALTGFARNLAMEMGPSGIRVNLVISGFVKTEYMPHTNEKVLNAMREATALKRLATPLDIARAVLFFASPLSEFITGTSLIVDGGFHLQGKPVQRS